MLGYLFRLGVHHDRIARCETQIQLGAPFDLGITVKFTFNADRPTLDLRFYYGPQERGHQRDAAEPIHIVGVRMQPYGNVFRTEADSSTIPGLQIAIRIYAQNIPNGCYDEGHAGRSIN